MESIYVNATENKSVSGICFIELTSSEKDTIKNLYEITNNKLDIARNEKEKNKILAKLAVLLLQEFCKKFANPTILVDNDVVAKYILIIASQKRTYENRAHVLLLQDNHILDEFKIMKLFSDEFLFKAEECKTNQLKSICKKYHGLSKSFDNISREVLTLLQLGATITYDQRRRLLTYLEIALRKNIVCNDYIKLVKRITATIKCEVFQATKYDYNLCLAEQYKVIKPLDSEKEKVLNLLRLCNKDDEAYNSLLKKAIQELRMMAIQKKVKLIITDSEEIFQEYTKEGSNVNIALYDSQGNIVDKNGTSLERASAILNFIMCYKS